MKPFDFGLDNIKAQLDANARERGFADCEAELAAESGAAAALADAEWAAKLPARREAIVSRVEGRVAPDVLAELRAGKASSSPTKASSEVRRWLGSSKPAIVLCGAPGAGKTVAAIRAMISHRSTWQYIRAADIGRARERWPSDQGVEIEPLRLSAGFMLVDDLGLEALEDRRVVQALDEIADARQSMSRRTVYTTNLTADQLRARYSERVRSRWAQSAVIVRIADSDHRRAK